MARKRPSKPAEQAAPDIGPYLSPVGEAGPRPECLTCPLKECRGKFTRARSDMGGGRTIHYVACTTCGSGNSYEEHATTEQPEA